MSREKQQKILKIILIFVLLQPILDILSRMAILGYIPNISTYVKPLFVFGFSGYLLFCYSPIKKRWLIYIGLFILLAICHLFLLAGLLVDTSTILHELRFMINIAYMIALFIGLFTFWYHTDDNDKEEVFRKIKNTLFYTFMLYFSLYLVSVLTGTSGMTYEYSDKYKLGYKGWNDSGQILGHAFSVLFPIVLYGILKPKNRKIIRTIFMILALVVVSLLGTKVPYFITIMVLILYLIIVLFIKFFNKEFERNWFNICLVFLSIIVLVLTYKYTPVAYNTDINDKNAMIELSKYDLNSISGKKKKKSYKEVVEKHKGYNISDFKQYYIWTQDASSYLESLFYAGKVHPSNTRGKQFFYSYKLFSLADYRYKLFGVGYLNQDALLAIESDFFMAIFDFGILGFLLFLFIPIKEFIKALMFIVKNLKRVDLETYMLFMGLGIFFCISIYAGYTYIYTNFSIFLVLLIVMLKLKIDIICIDDKKSIKSISFLGLHLGYGGIESSIINAANALSKKYDVEIISFYKLAEDQNKNVNSKVKIKYLYNGGPNLDKITVYRNNKQVLRLFGELVKALWILLLKRILVIREIRRCRSDAIVSTRVEFNLLLDNFGRESTLKIAQEHCYHNDNKKYINKIKSYHNLDYLCALTTTLKADYKRFLENSHSKVKVVLLPNMLVSLPKKKSSCNKKNLITVSRLDYGKRNDEIIEMFSKIDDKYDKLYIIGDGEEYERLEKLIADLKLEDRVKLLGYMSHKDMEKYLFDSSIFLMASVTEGLPMVLLEAMSYGIPCIAYKTASGTSDIIDNEYNGYIIENRDSDEYIKDINTLLDNDKLRMKYSKNAILTAKKFYKDEVVKMWEKLLK